MSTEHSYCQKVLRSLASFREQEFLTDVILIAGNSRIPAHRNVLSSCTEYFRAMFSESYTESSNKEITIKDIDGATLQIIVEFCYTGSLKPFGHDMALSILDAAEYFGIPEASVICYSFLKENVKSSKCLELLWLAERHNLQDLKDDAFRTIVSNFDEVRRFHNFVHLTAEQIGQILQSDELKVNSERDVFDALMDWYMFDKKNRESLLSPLLSFLQLPSLPPSVTLKLVLNQPIDYNEIVQLIRDLDWTVAPLRRGPKPSFGRRLVAVSFKFQGTDKLLQWMTFDENQGAWVDETRLTVNSSGKDVMTKGYKLVMGTSVLYLTHWSGNFFKYDLNTNQWDSADVNRKNSGTACIGDSLYISGGNKTHVSFEDTMDFLGEMKEDGFSYLYHKDRMRFKRQKSGLGVIGKKLYVVGGSDSEDEELRLVECYESTSNTWKTCQTLPSAMVNPTVCPLSGQLYCIRTRFRKDLPEPEQYSLRYDPETDTWMDIANPLHRCQYFRSMCTFNSELVLAGKDKILDRIIVMSYNPVKNAWREVPAPNFDIDNFQLVSLPEDSTARSNWLNLILK